MTDFRMVKRLWNKGSRWIEYNPIRNPIFQTKIFVNQPSPKNSKSQELRKVIKSTRWVLLKIARFLGLIALRLYIYTALLSLIHFNLILKASVALQFSLELSFFDIVLERSSSPPFRICGWGKFGCCHINCVLNCDRQKSGLRKFFFWLNY